MFVNCRYVKNSQCFSNLKLEIWSESWPTGRWLSPKNALFNVKIPILLLANTGVKPPFFRISRLKLQSHAGRVKWKVGCGELPLEITLLGLRHIVKAASETWLNLRVKVNSTLAGSFQEESCWDKDVISNVNFALSSNSKDQLGDLNQRLIIAINTLDGSTLGYNLITSHK